MMVQSKVIIVGAGAAGIAAASRLVKNNITNIAILEAEHRIGGRVFTSNFGEGVVELGAQWVHGEKNNVAHALGTSAGLLADNSYDVCKSKYILSDGTTIDDDIAWKMFSLCREMVHDESKLSIFKGSLGEYLVKNFKEKIEKNELDIDTNLLNVYLTWFERFQNSIDGSDSWFETSARGILQYHECEGNSLTRWKSGGYSNIFNLLMGQNSNLIKDKIILNKAVKRILWDSQPVQVHCSDGQVFTADHVLITVSLGVLKENASTLFVPPLPSKKLTAIQGLGIGTVAKIFVKFPYRWWPADCPGFDFLWKDANLVAKNEEDLSWEREVFGFWSVDNNPSVLCGWVGGLAARHMEQCSDTLVLQHCHRLLMQFLGHNYDIPLPDRVLRSQWYSNPHFRGSYSFRSVKSDQLSVSAADLAEPLCLSSDLPVLLFGGEATHNHFYSTVHGAIETGWREADRLISLIEPKRLPKASL